jgi:streptogramin lyase
VVDGASVFYGDSEASAAGVADVDSVVKFAPEGFSEDTVLRSSRSPSQLFFKVGMPQGAEMVTVPGSRAIAVRDAGQTLAVVQTPEAHDAEGLVVPVSMEATGDMIVISVERGEDQYTMPVVVDPTVFDPHLTEVSKYSDWVFGHNGSDFRSSRGENNLYIETDGPLEKGRYAEGQFAFAEYPTQKESRVYEFTANTTSSLLYRNNLEYTGLEGKLYIEDAGKIENLGGSPVGMPLSGVAKNTLCVAEGCAIPSVAGGEANGAFMELYAASGGESETGIELENGSSVGIVQENGPSAAVDTSDTSFDGLANAARANGWIKASAYAIGVTALDPGMGIDELRVSSPQVPGWGHGMKEASGCEGLQCNECWNYASRCEAGHSTSGEPLITGLTGLTDGEDTIETKVKDAVGLSATATRVVMVDNTPPHSIVLSGLGPGGQIGSGEYQLKAEATDGSGSTPSSGMSTLALSIDGHELGILSATCPLGPCTDHSGTWTIFGHNYAAGKHIVTITATDNAGNAASESFSMVVHPASSVALGPGSVNLQSGEFTLSATDVSMPGGLTVTRSYNSQRLTAGAEGSLGSQWVIGLGGQGSLVKQSTGSMVLTDSLGAQAIFAPNGSGGYISPPGDANLTLSTSPCETGQSEFRLEDVTAGTTTCFKVPYGGNGEVWTPHITQGAAPTDTVTYSYETVEVPAGSKNTVTRPNQALAPVPAGVGPCAPELKAGCKALTFHYATSTTAAGEELGNIEGDLEYIDYIAYEPSSKTMKTVEVARYLYDGQKRLRAVWDPEIKPSLKTYYGYDSEGHLTALTPPGQETWGIVYGTTSGGGSAGSVLKVARAPSSASVWSGTDVANTAMPEVTGSSTLGVRMAVTEGKWSGSPVVYGYQWEDCSPEGSECVAIPGATNANYTPTSKDEGHRLAAVVTATNGGGSVSVTVLAPNKTSPIFSSSFGSFGSGNGELREPEGGLAVDGSGDVWVSDTENSRLEEFNSKGEFVRTAGSYGEGADQFFSTYGLTIDSKGDLWATDTGNERVEEFNSEGVFLKMFGWGVANGEAKLETCTSSCRAGLQGPGNGEFYFPEGIAVDSKGDVFVADRGNHRVQEFSSELAWVRNISQAEEHEGPFYLTLDPNGNLWVTYSFDNKIGEFNNEGKLIRTWGTAGSGPGELSDPYGVGVGPEGDVWVAEYGNNRVQVFTPTGEYLYGFGSHGNGGGQFNDAPHGIAFSGTSTIYVLDSGIWWENTGNSRVEKWIIPPSTHTGTHVTQTIYYTKAANAKYPNCGEHPEWANLPCQTQPAEQPETSGLPNLPSQHTPTTCTTSQQKP